MKKSLAVGMIGRLFRFLRILNPARRPAVALGTVLALTQIMALATTVAGKPEALTDTGRVTGQARNGVLEFRGIPYGAAPVGDLRWAPPQPAPKWSGLRDAREFGPACAQQARFNLTEGSESEDCLSLNVTIPANAKPGTRLPVMFWLHGGGFVGGGSNLYRLDQLARDGGMIVVSANYRLGVLGFMPHPAFESADHRNGNYGLEDQRLALAWVQRNIAAFGGDPQRVTIAGESAGAVSICMHLASPERVKGLFDKAIIQSAGCLQPMKTVTEAQAVGVSVSTALNCRGDKADVLQCLRKKSVSELLSQQGSYTSSHPGDFLPFAPTVGTPAQPNASLPRGMRAAVDTDHLVKVPLMVGGTRHEVRLYVGYWWQGAQQGHNPPVDAANLAGWIASLYGQDKVSAILKHYRPADGWSDEAAVPETLGRLMADYVPGVSINNCMYLHSSQVMAKAFRQRHGKLPIYQFEFADEAAPVLGIGIGKPYPDFKLGSVHSSELNYLFPNFSNTSQIDAPDLGPASTRLANQMVGWWSNFVHHGNPNPARLSVWPAYSGGNTVMLLEPDNARPYNADLQHQCSAFWLREFALP